MIIYWYYFFAQTKHFIEFKWLPIYISLILILKYIAQKTYHKQYSIQNPSYVNLMGMCLIPNNWALQNLDEE